MRARDLADLALLAALWGASFLFLRVAVGAFGPLALIALRVVIAAAVLLPLAAWHGRLGAIRAHALPIAVTGILNSALPFVLLAYAALSLNAGFMSLLNAATPLWGALFAWLWLGDRPGVSRTLGLAVGVAGVAMLAWPHASFRPGGSGGAIAVCLLATLSYGLAANYARRWLAGVDALASAAGSLGAAAVAMLPLALLDLPRAMPSPVEWAAVALLGVGSTGLAYVLFFRLIANVGASRAIAVTFLVPVFAVLWGAVFLDEAVTLDMLAGGAVILAGTALATGLLGIGKRG